LRANGHNVEAARLQSAELTRTLDAARGATGTHAEVESRLHALFAVEEERVLNATVIAELLVPMLAARLCLAAPVPAPLVAAAAPAAAKPVRAGTPTIADFIDDMLDQERAPPRAPSLRRAS
jgi:hypothetical protein